MAKNNFVMNFHGPVGKHIDKVDHMTVNIESDGTIETDDQDNTAAKEVGRRLRELREDQRLNKTEVATRAGIKTSTLTAIEEGRYNTGIRQIADIAHTLSAHVAIVPDEQPIRSYI
jgi:DNA-binding XRE family transcriptional regulator